MENYEILMENMIQFHIMNRGIYDKNVIEAIKSIPRHIFVPKEYKKQAYEDKPLPTLKGQTISQPYIVALMTKLLKLNITDKVLEIGTGTGYHTAILSKLAHKIYSIERIAELMEYAKQNLNSLGIKNAYLFLGDGTLGLQKCSPYDKIIIEAAIPSIPKLIWKQLKEGGVLVAPIGDRHLQKLIVFKKKKEDIEKEDSISCLFVPLIGKYGFAD